MATKKSLYTHFGTSLWALAAIFALLPSWPHLYYRLSPKASQALANTIATTAVNPNTSVTPAPTTLIPGSDPESRKEPWMPDQVRHDKKLPEQDLSLPSKNGLIIEKIGVKGELYEGEDWDRILRKGIWRVPNFADPESTTDLPIILAAHRWGYLEWSAQFRKLNSFYNLPKLQKDDTIEVIWNQRKYKYKVTATSTGTEIPNYNHDLILYTCQLWNSPVRFFVYATRTN